MNTKLTIFLLAASALVGALVMFLILHTPPSQMPIGPDPQLKKEMHLRDSIIEVERGLKLASQAKFDSLQTDINLHIKSQVKTQIQYVTIYKKIDLQPDSSDNHVMDSIFAANGYR